MQTPTPDSQFHALFAHALSWSEIDSQSLIRPIGSCDQQRRFNIYRNNRMSSLIEVLGSTYPALHRLVGDEFFKASAKAFIEAQPPSQPVMAEYGREFGQFMSALPTVSALPYLRDVAELEWWHLQAYHCEDAAVFEVTQLSNIRPESVMDIVFNCHPALNLIESNWPVGSIWMRSSSIGDSFDTPIDMQQGEGVIITRPELQVRVSIISHAAIVFLRSIQQGKSLGAAAERALEADATFDAGSDLTGLIGLGAFSSFTG